MNQTKSSSNWIQWSISIFSEVFIVIMLIGMVFYVVAGYSKDTFEPFQLAIVVSLLSGFSLTGAFSDKCPKQLRLKLRRISTLELISTMSFIVFGLFQPVEKMNIPSLQTVITYSIVTSFYVGALAFIFSLVLTFTAIPDLLSNKED